ncbi:tRNA (adenine(22)-N(1))-methyltransferase [Rubripirellula reticaptiva]|uniref:tRNA (Adenine(22)-N(1))-methyltransferase n=1 Tax=Rubripirellula reticaptiva TaxID=2528013 RepID=A0A5C6EG14_9BACT|nr:class I SAM-dependent methyltransferase [Rubripirellula reticaptiva]TWU47882.1 tRNA (adenine(22)-N(1))-methyltransferase [Rubripirellula reticaptiva]
MPRLDDRLKAVASQIRCRVHADIGSDHAHLLKALLASGRIERGIAIENKPQPFRNSKATLAGYDADVRFADGFAGLAAGEADSVSICGMGGELMTSILDAHPDRVPEVVLLQPNRRPELLRRWGLRCRFDLVDEQVAIGHWAYPILRFSRRSSDTVGSRDVAYDGLDFEAAILFGPHLIRRWQSDFVDRLKDEATYLRKLDRLGEEPEQRLAAIERLMRVNT